MYSIENIFVSFQFKKWKIHSENIDLWLFCTKAQGAYFRKLKLKLKINIINETFVLFVDVKEETYN